MRFLTQLAIFIEPISLPVHSHWATSRRTNFIVTYFDRKYRGSPQTTLSEVDVEGGIAPQHGLVFTGSDQHLS